MTQENESHFYTHLHYPFLLIDDWTVVLLTCFENDLKVYTYRIRLLLFLKYNVWYAFHGMFVASLHSFLISRLGSQYIIIIEN